MKIPLAPSPRHFSLPFLLALAATGPAFAAAPALRDAVQAKLDAEYSSLEAIYKNLHAHPELSFMEFQTAALVAAELRALGFAVTEKVGITGVVGVLKNGSGPTLLIRADMDGLELTERGDLSYRSQNDGVMHACGHDGHMAMVLGAAARLADRRRPR
jgi:hippurate hydrolase